MPLDDFLGMIGTTPMLSANLPVQPLAEEDDDVLDRMPGGSLGLPHPTRFPSGGSPASRAVCTWGGGGHGPA